MKNGKRIWIIGSPGAGKTTISSLLSQILLIRKYELDGFLWKENWKKNDKNNFIYEIENILKSSDWILDGQYTYLKEILMPKVNIIIWVESNFFKSLYRLIFRSLDRIIYKKRLWNNNFETFRGAFNLIFYFLRVYFKNKKNNKKLFETLAKNQSHIKLIKIKN